MREEIRNEVVVLHDFALILTIPLRDSCNWRTSLGGERRRRLRKTYE